jgi:UDP-N-acetylmuramate--alanine ligase
MHIHFIAIGGAGIGPLSLVAHKAGYQVSGSDIKNSSYIEYLKKHAVENITIGNDLEIIEKIHASQPIDWVVYSSAVSNQGSNPPFFDFCRNHDIKLSKRDQFINHILEEKKLEMVAIAGTHGKTTTTAMLVWLYKYFNKPLSYLLPAKVNYAEMGDYDPNSKYFVYEADEFDRNFLAFKPNTSLITGVGYDHQEIYPTIEDYNQAFNDFISASQRAYIWQQDVDYLDISGDNLNIEEIKNPKINDLHLPGEYIRYDGWLAVNAFSALEDIDLDSAIDAVNKFPGLSRRMEQLVSGLYSDYAHTPEKIISAMSVAKEMANESGQKIIVIYEPLTNRRQLYIKDKYRDCFKGANKLYWLPSYLAREDPKDEILEPDYLISKLSDPSIAISSLKDPELKQVIADHLKNGDMVVAMAGGGGDSLDDWLRQEFC